MRGPEARPTGVRLLAPLSYVYGVGALVRAAAYETGYFRVRRLSRPVISVGNITVGGTGKTPIVSMLSKFLLEQHLKVAVLTRGYGRQTRDRHVVVGGDTRPVGEIAATLGDEPALLAREVPGLAIVVDADRYTAGCWAEAEFDPDVFLLDDGFQHLKLARDLNILVVDATDPFGDNKMPPLGRLREPVVGIRRADAVIVTRADRSFDEALIERVVRGICREGTPVFYAWHDILEVRPLDGGPARPAYDFRDRRVAILTAIGNPTVFRDDLTHAGMDIVASSLFPDHHRFTQQDVDGAIANARANNASLLLITEKDAVKLEGYALQGFPVYAVRIAFASDQEALIKSLVLKTVLRHQHGGQEKP